MNGSIHRDSNGLFSKSRIKEVVYNLLGKIYDRPLEIRSAKTQISFRKKLKTYFFGQVFPTWILGGTVDPDDKRKRFWNMSLITNMFVAPLSSDHRGFRHYRSLLLLLSLFHIFTSHFAILWKFFIRLVSCVHFVVIDLISLIATENGENYDSNYW